MTRARKTTTDPKNLNELTAADIMQTELVELQASSPVLEAVETFEEYRISGAPVVNESRELVGVLSESDIVKAEHVDQNNIRIIRKAAETEETDLGADPSFGREDYNLEVLRNETVGDWMTAEVVSVTPESTLREICEIMAREQIHRVFVVNGGKLKGLITTFDVVSVLAEKL